MSGMPIHEWSGSTIPMEPSKESIFQFRLPRIMEGETIVNGVALPHRVVQELKRLGIAISWYTHAELEEAVQACAVDSQLIDDIDGINFRDKMKLTPHEHDPIETLYPPMNIPLSKKKSHLKYVLDDSDEEEESEEQPKTQKCDLVYLHIC